MYGYLYVYFFYFSPLNWINKYILFYVFLYLFLIHNSYMYLAKKKQQTNSVTSLRGQKKLQYKERIIILII
jgi:hypothetical protein